jgi:uncharacterized protein (DUF362 family)
MKSVVSIVKQDKVSYSSLPPYNPPELFPELIKRSEVDTSNEVYRTVRELFHILGYDKANFGTKHWNPLNKIVKPGQKVFIKPNMIAEKHKHNNDWEYVITHGSVIRAVIDYVFIAMQGEGRVMIGDAPQTDSSFSAIVERMGLKEIREVYKEYKDFEFEIINLQEEHWIEKDGIYLNTVKLLGDPQGSVSVNLGHHSMFAELDGKGKKYYGAFYDVEETNHHHSQGKHEYLVSRSPLHADVFINIPKLKTHKKCGLTVNLKSLVGINAKKNWLPHYVIGSPETGGDQFPRSTAKSSIENSIVMHAKKVLLKKNSAMQFAARKLKSIAYKIFGDNKHIVRSGNWYGNDTVWRMALDLNRILMYANIDGSMRSRGEAKKFFYWVLSRPLIMVLTFILKTYLNQKLKKNLKYFT